MPLLALSEFPFSYKNNKLENLFFSFLHSKSFLYQFHKPFSTCMTYSSSLYFFGPSHSINVIESKALSLLSLPFHQPSFKFWTSLRLCLYTTQAIEPIWVFSGVHLISITYLKQMLLFFTT